VVTLVSRVVDQDVEASECFERLLHQAFAEPGIADVAGDRAALPAELVHEPDRFFAVVGVVRQAGNHDLRAFLGVQQRHRATNTAVAAGDQCDAVLETGFGHVTLLAVICRRRHLRLIARWRLRRLRERRLRTALARIVQNGTAHERTPDGMLR